MKKLLLFALLTSAMQISTAQVQRKVLVEDFTGAWCGFCPYGISYFDDIMATYPTSVITMALHGPTAGSPYYEPMANSYTTSLGNTYSSAGYLTGYPGTLVDRVAWSGNPIIGNYTNHNYIKDYAAQRLNVSSPVSIDIISSYNAGTSTVTVTVNVNFVGAATGDMRINCLLIEDKVTGNGASAYRQSNYLGNGCNYPKPGNPFYSKPCLISTSASGFYHKNVVRYNMAGTFVLGTTGVIPTTGVSAGSHYTKTYTYTGMPSTWVPANMKVVAFIMKYGNPLANAEVMNAQIVNLGSSITAVGESPDAANSVSLEPAFPNPFSDITTLTVNIPATQHVSVKIYDLLGHEVAVLTDENLAPGEHTFYWSGTGIEGAPLSNGLYLVRLQTDKQVLSRSIVLSRN